MMAISTATTTIFVPTLGFWFAIATKKASPHGHYKRLLGEVVPEFSEVGPAQRRGGVGWPKRCDGNGDCDCGEPWPPTYAFLYCPEGTPVRSIRWNVGRGRATLPPTLLPNHPEVGGSARARELNGTCAGFASSLSMRPTAGN